MKEKGCTDKDIEAFFATGTSPSLQASSGGVRGDSSSYSPSGAGTSSVELPESSSPGRTVKPGRTGDTALMAAIRARQKSSSPGRTVKPGPTVQRSSPPPNSDARSKSDLEKENLRAELKALQLEEAEDAKKGNKGFRRLKKFGSSMAGTRQNKADNRRQRINEIKQQLIDPNDL
eukprot:g190.t1